MPLSLENLDNSMLVDNCLSTEMTRKGETYSRCTHRFDQVDCYRNLGKGDMFSIKQRAGIYKGLVSGYARSIIIKNPKFHVVKSGTQRVRKNNTKEVHAYVRGEFYDCTSEIIDVSVFPDMQRVSYNPYISDQFYMLKRDSEGQMLSSSIQPIEDAMGFNYALIQEKDVFLLKLS